MDKKTSGANDPLKKGDKNMEIFRTSCDLRKGMCIQYKTERRLKPGADGTVWTAEKAQDCLCLEVFCNNKGQYPCSGLIDNTPKKGFHEGDPCLDLQTSRGPNGTQKAEQSKVRHQKTKLTLSKEEPRSAGSGILIALGMQRLRDRRWATEEYTNVRIRVFLSQGREYTVPVRPPEMRWSPEGSNRILLSPDVLNLAQE